MSWSVVHGAGLRIRIQVVASLIGRQHEVQVSADLEREEKRWPSPEYDMRNSALNHGRDNSDHKSEDNNYAQKTRRC